MQALRPQNNPLAAFAPDSALNLPGLVNEQNTAVLAVTSTAASVAVRFNAAPQVEVYNAGPNDCFIAFGDATIVAVAPSGSVGSYPLGAGHCKIITLILHDSLTTVSAVTDTVGKTATLYVSPGVGAS